MPQPAKNNSSVISDEIVMEKIYVVRGQKVMIDSDLSALYQVETKRLNEQVSRNMERFPEDFMFQLTMDEFENLKSQFAASSGHNGNTGWAVAANYPMLLQSRE